MVLDSVLPILPFSEFFLVHLHVLTKSEVAVSTFFAVVLLVLCPHVDTACTNRDRCRDEYNQKTREFYRTFWGLTEVPRDIPAEALKVNLYGNAITSLPAGVFSHLTQCTFLSLGNNDIALREKKSFSGLPALKELRLYNNSISVLQLGVFSGLTNLTTLTLEGNQISQINGQVFTELESLETLRIYSNRISVLQPGMLSPLKNLKRLSLMKNQITHIEEGTFDNLHFLHGVFCTGINSQQLPQPSS